MMSKDARSIYERMGGQFRGDSKDASLWRTDAEGGMWARGVGGTILGIGWDLGIVDDPFSSRLEATNPNTQEKTEEWFLGDFLRRENRFHGVRCLSAIV